MYIIGRKMDNMYRYPNDSKPMKTSIKYRRMKIKI